MNRFIVIALGLAVTSTAAKAQDHAKQTARPSTQRPVAQKAENMSWEGLKFSLLAQAKAAPEVKELKEVSKEILGTFTDSEWKELDQITADYWAASDAIPFNEGRYRAVLARQHALFKKVVKRAGYDVVEHITKDNEYKAFISKGGKSYDLDMDVSGVTLKLVNKKAEISLANAVGEHVLPNGDTAKDLAKKSVQYEVMIHSSGDASSKLRDVLKDQKFYLQLGYQAEKLHKTSKNSPLMERYIHNDGFYYPMRHSILDSFPGSKFDFSETHDLKAKDQMHLN